MTNIGKFACGLSGLFAIAIPVALYAHIAGPDPRHTAAPGDDPLACATSGCHTGLPKGGPINPAGGGVTAIFSTGSTYPPGGGPITITVNVSDPVNSHHGFQMTARLESDLANAQAGDFTADTSSCSTTTYCQIVLCDNGEPKPSKGCPASSPVEFIEHSDQPFGASTGPMTFTWTPPATNAGPVHFYVAGNAVNNDNLSDAADHVYTNSYVLQPLVPFVCTNTATPVITSINSATDFGGFPSFAPGSWLEIKGSNLSDPSDTRLWTGSDFNGANAPTKLDGVSATVNGAAAAVYYISPTQINVQAPALSTTGPVPVTVTNCTATSTATMVTAAALVPGLLAPAAFNVGGTQYLAALFQDGVTFVGKTGLIAGVPFAPAKPGDLITAYGIGFGNVTPAFPPGVVVSGLNALAGAFSVSFGATPADPVYAGLAPNNIGLYQFNIVVPNVANGDYPINMSVGGVAAQKAFLTVQK